MIKAARAVHINISTSLSSRRRSDEATDSSTSLYCNTESSE